MTELKSYPLISIVIPVYNSEKYIRKSLESALNQTYPNLEIVVGNNGSNDNSADIIREYVIKHDNISYFEIEHVPTVKQSRDNCIYRAKGEWIVALDSDDLLEPEYVMKLWNRHVETGADWVGGTMVGVDENQNIFFTIPRDNFDYSQIISGVEACKKTFPWMFSANGALIKKEHYTNLYLDNPNCMLYTDEVDTRIHLINSTCVAFVRANYFYDFNPSSVGRSDNWGRVCYNATTALGLIRLYSIYKNELHSVKNHLVNMVIANSYGIHMFKKTHKVTAKESMEMKQLSLDLLCEAKKYVRTMDIKTFVKYIRALLYCIFK